MPWLALDQHYSLFPYFLKDWKKFVTKFTYLNSSVDSKDSLTCIKFNDFSSSRLVA